MLVRAQKWLENGCNDIPYRTPARFLVIQLIKCSTIVELRTWNAFHKSETPSAQKRFVCHELMCRASIRMTLSAIYLGLVQLCEPEPLTKCFLSGKAASPALDSHLQIVQTLLQWLRLPCPGPSVVPHWEVLPLGPISWTAGLDLWPIRTADLSRHTRLAKRTSSHALVPAHDLVRRDFEVVISATLFLSRTLARST